MQVFERKIFTYRNTHTSKYLHSIKNFRECTNVYNCTTERLFSCFKRVKNLSAQTDKKLDNLARLHIDDIALDRE